MSEYVTVGLPPLKNDDLQRAMRALAMLTFWGGQVAPLSITPQNKAAHQLAAKTAALGAIYVALDEMISDDGSISMTRQDVAEFILKSYDGISDLAREYLEIAERQPVEFSLQIEVFRELLAAFEQ